MTHYISERNKYILNSPEKTNGELAGELGLTKQTISKIRGQTRHALKPNGKTYTGAIWEEYISSKLTQIGIKNELMPFRHPFDILAEGHIRIDVKAAATPQPPSPFPIPPDRSISYVFGIKGDYKRDDADFYICIVTPTKDIFVIPANEVPHNQHHITFSWPINERRPTKWHKFHNRFDLIKDTGNEPPTAEPEAEGYQAGHA